MQIAIDAVGISQVGGGRTSTLNLLHGLLAIDRENQYTVYLERPEPSLREHGGQVQQRVIPFQNRFLARLWCQATWPALFRLERADLVHFTRSVTVFGVPCKQIITIHDLTILLLPEIYPRSDVLYWRYLQPLNVRQADHVVAVSQDVARDIHRIYGLAPDRITVVYNAYPPHLRPIPPAEAKPILDKYRLTAGYILHVGSISLKKNLLPLLKATALLGDSGVAASLVLVGREYGRARDPALHEAISSRYVADAVHFTGPVPDTDLAALYSGARVLAFPSLHEGFGIVAVEAMACGLPVVSSGQGAIPEVTGDAAWTVEDAHNPEAWAHALGRVLTDDDLHHQMRSRGLDRASHFSREASARQMLALYQQVVNAG